MDARQRRQSGFFLKNRFIYLVVSAIAETPGQALQIQDGCDAHSMIRIGWILQERMRRLNVQASEQRMRLFESHMLATTVAENKRLFSDKLHREYDVWREFLFPWITVEAVSKEDETKQATTAWKNTFGDPNDPEVQAKIQATVEFLERHNKATR